MAPGRRTVPGSRVSFSSPSSSSSSSSSSSWPSCSSRHFISIVVFVVVVVVVHLNEMRATINKKKGQVSSFLQCLHSQSADSLLFPIHFLFSITTEDLFFLRRARLGVFISIFFCCCCCCCCCSRERDEGNNKKKRSGIVVFAISSFAERRLAFTFRANRRVLIAIHFYFHHCGRCFFSSSAPVPDPRPVPVAIGNEKVHHFSKSKFQCHPIRNRFHRI